MERPIAAPLTGVARAKYVRDFTGRINNHDKFADIFSSNKTQLLAKSRKSFDPKTNVTISAKKKRKLVPKLSVKLQQKKDPDQEYIVQRMKFLRQSIEIVNEAVNRTMKNPESLKPPAIRFTQTKFQQFKNKSFEIEKQKLEEMYKADMQNLNLSMEPIAEPNDDKRSKSLIRAPKPHPEEPESPTEITKPCTIDHNLATTRSIILQDSQKNDEDNVVEIQPKEDRHQPETTRTEPSKEVPQIQPSEQIRESPSQDNSNDKAIQLCQNQLQNINLNSNHCNALVPLNNIATSRRICHRNKRFRRHLMKPFCAHCHDLITDVAYFSGTQQLCFECADRHYERVSRARFRDRPMGYREFKNIGGDTIYNKS
ncbi:uncharacterized protein LOC135842283 [Planococcus citri]|uniref:uncharacterized protein LOC135842283 n=1 Tax=Planococcus citri TaxID=170843 RepID=UPI0031F95C1E